MPHNHIRHKSQTALVLIDVINDFAFPDGRQILRHALRIAPALARLKQRARKAGVATIYVNDNFGQWRSDTRELLKHCLRPESPGSSFVQQVAPDEEDYLVLKPMHSAFYQTPLDALLRFLGASSIVLCGVATNSCIVCTAHDAQMRSLQLTVASDCCAARTVREHNRALEHIEDMAGGRVVTSASVRFNARQRGTG